MTSWAHPLLSKRKYKMRCSYVLRKLKNNGKIENERKQLAFFTLYFSPLSTITAYRVSFLFHKFLSTPKFSCGRIELKSNNENYGICKCCKEKTKLLFRFYNLWVVKCHKTKIHKVRFSQYLVRLSHYL